ncbi:hypothetical protein AB1L42_17925 [Thalassoglobus sp. JC818]|uniref:hypothetical protein n=1 Tax=Thalassoglobus sp. JC818 TaxID=3232136 RepID=UPI00345AAD40
MMEILFWEGELFEKVLVLMVFFVPVCVISFGLLFVEERDTTSFDNWRLGEKDPFRFVFYDSNRNIRPWVRPVALLAGSACLTGAIWFTVMY